MLLFTHCHQQCRSFERVLALLQRVKKRPVSPHVFETDGAKFHYKMPINATTSIINRATGVALTVGKDIRCWPTVQSGQYPSLPYWILPSCCCRNAEIMLQYVLQDCFGYSCIAAAGLLHSPMSQRFAGMTGAGLIALTGDLPATVETLKHTSPALLYPIKAAVAFPLVYHYLGGLRHVIWDKASYGNQVQ